MMENFGTNTQSQSPSSLLCDSCNRAISEKEANKRYPYAPSLGTPVSCQLCRLIGSTIDLAQSMRIEPFRSYRLRVLGLLHDPRNVLPPTDQRSSDEQGHLDWIGKLPSNEYSFEEMYTETTREFPQKKSQDPKERYEYVATIKARRLIEINAHLPRSSLGPGLYGAY
jgi:hypothetical protein